MFSKGLSLCIIYTYYLLGVSMKYYIYICIFLTGLHSFTLIYSETESNKSWYKNLLPKAVLQKLPSKPEEPKIVEDHYTFHHEQSQKIVQEMKSILTTIPEKDRVLFKIQYILKSAKEEKNKGALEIAQDLYQFVLYLDPNNQPASLSLAEIDYFIYKQKEVTEEKQKLTSEIKKARTAFLKGHKELYRTILSEISKKYPDDPQVKDFIVEIEHTKKQLEIQKQNRDKATQLLPLATEEFQNKNYEKAIELFIQILNLDPSHRMAQQGLENAKVGLAENKIKILLKEAKALEKDKNYSEAQNKYSAILELNPQHELARNNLDSIKKKIFSIQHDEFFEYFQNSIQRNDFNKAKEIYGKLENIGTLQSELQILNQQLQKAIQEYEQKELYHLIDSLLAEAKTHWQKNNFEEAKALLEKAQKLAKDYQPTQKALEHFQVFQIDYFYKKADQALDGSQFKECQNWLDQIFQIDAQHSPAQKLRNKLKRAQERYNEDQLQHLIQQAAELLQNSQFDSARQLYEEALQLYPNHPEIIKKLEELNKQEIQYQQKQLQEKNMQLYQEALQNLKKDQLPQAQSCINEILNSNPHDEKALELLQKIKEQENQFKENTIRNIIEKGYQHISQHQFQEAIETFEGIRNIDSQDQRIEVLIQKALLAQKHYQEEQAQMVNLEKEIITILDNINTLLAQNQFENARTALQKPLNLAPQDTRLNTALQRINLAEQEYRNKLEKTEKVRELIQNANQYMDKNQFSEARDNLKSALTLDPENTTAIEVVQTLKNKQSAYEAILAKNEKIEKLYKNAVSIFEQQHFSSAEQMIHDILEIDSQYAPALQLQNKIQSKLYEIKVAQIETLYQQAKDQLKNNQFTSAENGFKEILAIDPNHKKARIGLKQVEEKINQVLILKNFKIIENGTILTENKNHYDLSACPGTLKIELEFEENPSCSEDIIKNSKVNLKVKIGQHIIQNDYTQLMQSQWLQNGKIWHGSLELDGTQYENMRGMQDVELVTLNKNGIEKIEKMTVLQIGESFIWRGKIQIQSQHSTIENERGSEEKLQIYLKADMQNMPGSAIFSAFEENDQNISPSEIALWIDLEQHLSPLEIDSEAIVQTYYKFGDTHYDDQFKFQKNWLSGDELQPMEVLLFVTHLSQAQLLEYQSSYKEAFYQLVEAQEWNKFLPPDKEDQHSRYLILIRPVFQVTTKNSLHIPWDSIETNSDYIILSGYTDTKAQTIEGQKSFSFNGGQDQIQVLWEFQHQPLISSSTETEAKTA